MFVYLTHRIITSLKKYFLVLTRYKEIFPVFPLFQNHVPPLQFYYLRLKMIVSFDIGKPYQNGQSILNRGRIIYDIRNNLLMESFYQGGNYNLTTYPTNGNAVPLDQSPIQAVTETNAA